MFLSQRKQVVTSRIQSDRPFSEADNDLFFLSDKCILLLFLELANGSLVVW